jgi:CRISPR/Cas system-associated endoribonuclease Cas2
MKIKYYKKAYLPHIHYTIYFKDLSELQGVEIKGSAYTIDFDKNTSIVFIENIKKNSKEKNALPTIAHEIVHVLQNICESRMMDFTSEKEHTAYIMSYLLNVVTEHEYYTPPTKP